MKAFGVFQGGGVKGLAHIGAYKAAKERGIEFEGVAGTSAGAIVAALIAVGYTPDELYVPDPPSGHFEKSYLDFLEAPRWQQVETCQKGLRRVGRLIRRLANAGAVLLLVLGMLLLGGLLFFAGDSVRWITLSLLLLICGAGLWLSVPFMAATSVIVRTLLERRGLFQTKAFQVWLNQLLSARVLARTGKDDTVAFRDVGLPLKIVASDITNQKPLIFSQSRTPEASVAEAVAASIRIPFFFQPDQYHDSTLADGGLLSNLPAWVFDNERRKEGANTPTLAFKLIERPLLSGSSTAEPSRRFSALLRFGGYLLQIISTMSSGGEQLQYRQISNLLLIPLKVSVSTLKFDLNVEDRRLLYEDGLKYCQDGLHTLLGPRDPVEMKNFVLKSVHDSFRNALRLPEAHLRVAVLLPICVDPLEDLHVLRVCYSFNMDEDADDHLELSQEAGASGLCWTERRVVACDLEQARTTYASQWKMTKYQQALVRPSLKSLLCAPIRVEFGQEPILGVLAFDSDDEALLEIFTRVASTEQDARIEKIRLSVGISAIIVGKHLKEP